MIDYGAISCSSDDSSSSSTISIPLRLAISFSLWGIYPSFWPSTNGDKWGGSGLPGVYWVVGSKIKLLILSTTY